MNPRCALAALVVLLGCKGERREPAKLPEPARGSAVAGNGSGSGSSFAGSDGTVEPVFQNGQQVDRDGIPELPFAIDRVYENQQATATAPFHAAGGTWTYFDAHVASDPSATFVVGVPPLAAGKGDEPFSFGKAMLVPTTAQAGARVVFAFAHAFHVPVPPLSPGQLAPLKVEMAVLGHGIADAGNGYGGPGTWDATKLFLSSDDIDSAEIFFNYSLAEKKGVFSEKDADYDKDIARVLALALRDGQPLPRTPATDPTLAAKPAELVMGPRVPGKRVDVIANTAQRAIATIEYDDHSALVAIDLATGSVQSLFSTKHELGVGSCDRELHRCVVQEVTPKSRTERTGDDPARLLVLDGSKVAPLAIPVGGYDLVRMSPDAKFLTTGFQTTIAWDLRTRRKLATLADDHAERDFIAWRDDGIVFAHHPSGSMQVDRYELWNVERGTLDKISLPAEAFGTPAPDGSRRIDAGAGKVYVTPLPGGLPRNLVLHPNDYKAVDGACCEWLDSRYVALPGKHFGFLDTDAMKVSLLPDAADDDRVIHVLDGSGHALVTTGGATFLATVKP